jgi:hypothetical protein
MQVAGAVAVDGRSGTGRTFATQLVCTRIGMPTVTLRRCRIVRSRQSLPVPELGGANPSRARAVGALR